MSASHSTSTLAAANARMSDSGGCRPQRRGRGALSAQAAVSVGHSGNSSAGCHALRPQRPKTSNASRKRSSVKIHGAVEQSYQQQRMHC